MDQSVVKAICIDLHLIHATDPLTRPPVTTGLRYFRLHGIGAYRYRYSDADLDRLAECCRGETYVMFNNVSMAQDALRFCARCG